MKHSLYSGCLLRRVFEVELKMSSFLYQRNVPRGEIVIQIGGFQKKEKIENPSSVLYTCAIYNTRQDIAASRWVSV